MLAEALRAGKANPYPKYIFIPVKINCCPFQYNQLANKLLDGLLEEWCHIEGSVLVSLGRRLNRGRSKQWCSCNKGSHRAPILEARKSGLYYPPLHHWPVIRSCCPQGKEHELGQGSFLQLRESNSWRDIRLRAVNQLSKQVGEWVPQSWRGDLGRQCTTESTTIMKW